MVQLNIICRTSCPLSVLSAAPHLGLLCRQLVLPGADRYFPARAFWVQLQRPQSVPALHPAQTGSLPPASALQPGVCCSDRHSESTANWPMVASTKVDTFQNKGTDATISCILLSGQQESTDDWIFYCTKLKLVQLAGKVTEIWLNKVWIWTKKCQDGGQVYRPPQDGAGDEVDRLQNSVSKWWCHNELTVVGKKCQM